MKQNLSQDVQHFSRYATFTDSTHSENNPLHALQRDELLASVSGESGDQSIRPIYASQLQQLECLIRTQKEFQELMKSNYNCLLEKYKHVVNELQKLKRHLTTTNMNKLSRDKTILERKLIEQVNARMTLENLLRTLLQALRQKSTALEQLKKQMNAIKNDRDNLKLELNKMKENTSMMDKRVCELPNCSRQTECDKKSENRSKRMYNNGLTTLFVARQRSFEVLTKKKSGKNSPSFTRSLGKINSTGSVGVTTLRPSIPLNLLRSNVKLNPEKLSEAKLPPCSTSISLNLPIPLNKSLSSNVNVNSFRLGYVNVRPETTWDQFDVDVRSVLYGYIQTIVQATKMNCFTNVLRSTAENFADSSEPHSLVYDTEANLEALGLEPEIRFHLGPLDWPMGSPPDPNSLSVQRCDPVQGVTPQGCSISPYDLFFDFPSTFTMKNNLQSIDESRHRSSNENGSIERGPIIQHQLLLDLDPITQVSIQCGVSPVCVKTYMDAIKSHLGLILMTDTGLLWATLLIKSLAEHFMSQVGTDGRTVKRYTLTRESLLTGSNSFNLRSWLYKQNLIHYGPLQTEDEPERFDENVLLVFETMDFLKLKSNQKFFCYLLGISGEMDEKLAWAPRFKRAFMLGLSDSSSIDWLRSFSQAQSDSVWLVQTDSQPMNVDRPQLPMNSILVHEFNLNRSPLIDAVPVRLRLAAHKLATGLDGARSTNKCSSVTQKTGKLEISEDTHLNASAMFRWVEGIWTRLYLCVKWLGLHRTEQLGLEPDKCAYLPWEFQTNTSVSTDPTGTDTTIDKSQWIAFAHSLIKAQLDAKTDRLLSELLDPDHFLTFPGIHAALNEDRVVDFDAMLKWIELEWNATFEPGLQTCALSASSLVTDSENKLLGKPPANIKQLDPLKVRHRLQGLYSQGSDVAAALFLRQIVMPECPLKGNARLIFATRLTGGDAFHPRLGHMRRFPFDASDTVPLSFGNKTSKSVIRVIGESHTHKRTTADQCRTRIKISDWKQAYEQSDTVGNRCITVPSTARRKKQEDISGRVRLTESSDVGERTGNIISVRSGSCGSGIKALASCQDIHNEPYRPVRFRTRSPHRSWSERSTMQINQMREHGPLMHRVNVNDLLVSEDYLDTYNPVSIV